MVSNKNRNSFQNKLFTHHKIYHCIKCACTLKILLHNLVKNIEWRCGQVSEEYK